MAIKRILVPVDFSADSLSALQYAGEFAKTFKAELLVLYVVEPVYYATPTDMYAASAESAILNEEQRRVAAEQLTRLSADLKKKGLRFRTMVKDGSASRVIVETAQTAAADLIIMATHGRTGLAHMFMGSVAEKVVRSATCPVLTARHGGRHPAPRKRERTAKAK